MRERNGRGENPIQHMEGIALPILIAVSQSGGGGVFFIVTASFKLQNRICRKKEDPRARFGMKEKYCSSFVKLNVHSLSYPKGSRWSLFSLSKNSAFRDMGHFSKWSHLATKVPEFAHTVDSLSVPRGVEIGIIFLLYGQALRHTGQFSTLPYLRMNAGHWQKFQKLLI